MSEKRTEVEILSYFLEHPSASDTPEGITEWWLLERRITTAITTVREALKKLVEMGFVIVSKRPGRAETYSLDKEKFAEIQLWLDSQATR